MAGGPIAAVTFAADEDRTAAFSRRVEEHREVLQPMAMYFHAHARRKLAPDRVVETVCRYRPANSNALDGRHKASPPGETGRILGISRRTAAFHLAVC
jgi:LuxR family transcriptional regulator, activator of conjugal transfer of Ti plasmids